jgi:excisionase family DNA binding protein
MSLALRSDGIAGLATALRGVLVNRLEERANTRSVVAKAARAREHPPVTMRTGGSLLTTGEAAVLLRSSRAHVADLCLRGLLPYVTVGAQRRVRRADVEALIQPSLDPEQLQALWLHRAIAGKVVQRPAAVLAAVAINLRRLRRLHPDGSAGEWTDRWELVLEDGVEAVLEALTSSAEYAVELRRRSPFAGILTESERRRVLASLAESRRDHARTVTPDKVERVLHGL